MRPGCANINKPGMEENWRYKEMKRDSLAVYTFMRNKWKIGGKGQSLIFPVRIFYGLFDCHTHISFSTSKRESR